MKINLPTFEQADMYFDKLPMQKLNSRADLDVCLSEGYRFLGANFLRDTVNRERGSINIPLRIRLKDFTFSKSQRKLLKTNKLKFSTEIRSAIWNADRTRLFMQHRMDRFGYMVSPWDFFPEDIAETPTTCIEFDVFPKNKITAPPLACSFVHLGEKCISSTFCCHDMTYEKDSLGHFTMLLEIEYAIAEGYEYYYLGNVESKPSLFDYKLNFNALEAFGWLEYAWIPVPRVPLFNWQDFEKHIIEDGNSKWLE